MVVVVDIEVLLCRVLTHKPTMINCSAKNYVNKFVVHTFKYNKVYYLHLKNVL